MSTNYGNTSTASNNAWVSNSGTCNQYGFIIGGVPQGTITALDVYMAGSGGTCRTILCLWDYPSGTLLAQTAQFTAGAGSGGFTGQAWHRAVLTTPYTFTGTKNFYVGFWRNPADGAEFGYQSGTVNVIRPQINSGVTNVGSPSTLSVGTGTSGDMGAYLEWNPSGVYGSHSAGAPVALQGIYGSHTAGAPVAILGVYRGPSGGGVPIRIW